MVRANQSTARGGTTESLPAPDSVVRQASGEQAADYIRRLIFDGELEPGTRLPQDEIARVLGVSRIPIREAVVALEREGWVTTELHRGAFINPLDEDTIRDHYELFALIYGLAIRRAIARNDPEVIARLAALARQVAATEDPSEVGRGAIAFHSTAVEAARSPRIRVVLRAMSAMLPGPFFELVPAAIPLEQRGLAAIVRHAKKGNADGAAEEYLRMFRLQAEVVVELFRRRNKAINSRSA